MNTIEVCIFEHTDELFGVAVREAMARGKVVSAEFAKNLRPRYNAFQLVGYTSHGGTARIVVDLDEPASERA